MESDNGTRAQRAFKERLAQAKEIGRVAGKIAVEEAMAWDVFRWIAIVLLVLNLLLILLVYGATFQETAQDGDNYASELAALRTELSEQFAEAKAELTADIVAAQFGLQEPTSQAEPEPTGSIRTPSIPVPSRSPRRR
jgi:hypothetical protein